MIRDDFAVLILTHGRADNVVTVRTLERCGYTGRTYIVIDDEDEQGDRYRELYGDSVIVFDKAEEAKTTDTMDASSERNVVVFARNAAFRIAAELGLTFFLVLDDDYDRFSYRWVDSSGKLKDTECKQLDRLFTAYCDFLYTSDAATVAMAQNGDFIGGAQSTPVRERVLRKAMNSFFCMTERPFRFMGRINEDVNAYVSQGAVGKLFMTACDASLHQGTTQQNAGGLTDSYLEHGTYVKSFYSVMIAPSCVRVRAMGDRFYRMHHAIDWRHAVPKIVSGRHCKRLV